MSLNILKSRGKRSRKHTARRRKRILAKYKFTQPRRSDKRKERRFIRGVHGSRGVRINPTKTQARRLYKAQQRAGNGVHLDIDINSHNAKRGSKTRVNPSGGPLWQYKDATGVTREGRVIKTVDLGGTDVTYFFQRADGKIDVVSGSRLKQAKVLYKNPRRRTPSLGQVKAVVTTMRGTTLGDFHSKRDALVFARAYAKKHRTKVRVVIP